MPRITELPNNAALTGAEVLAIVQDGETRHVSVADIASLPLPAAAVNARWLRSNADAAFINNTALDLVLPPQNPAP